MRARTFHFRSGGILIKGRAISPIKIGVFAHLLLRSDGAFPHNNNISPRKECVAYW